MKRLRCGVAAIVVTVLFSASAVALGPFGPDLQIRSVSAPASAVAGTEIQVSVRFVNRGVGGADSFMAELWLEEQVVGRRPLATARWSVRNLPPGEDVLERRILRLPATLAAGAYSLRAFADRDLSVTESDEGNNVAVRPIRVTAPPPAPTMPPSMPAGSGTVMAPAPELRTDLEMVVNLRDSYAVGILKSESRPQDPIGLRGAIRNLGNTAVVPSTASLVLRSPTGTRSVLRSESIPQIPAGGEFRVALSGRPPAGTPPGQYSLLLAADADGAFAESDESNNESGTTVTIIGPDLRTQRLEVVPGSVAPDEYFNVSLVIVNDGRLEASAAPYRIVLSATRSLANPTLLMTSESTMPLAAGQSVQRSDACLVPPGTVPGTYYVGILVDPHNVVAEESERNNTGGPLALVITP
ncbi:MAG: CARDB domain-containing protein [Acidobacteriota bacterium]